MACAQRGAVELEVAAALENAVDNGGGEVLVVEDAVVHTDDMYPERSLIVGTSDRGRLLLCVHVKSQEEIRIISARPLTKREKKNYEEGT